MRPSFKHLHNHDNDEDNDAQANIDRAGDSTNSNARQKPILFQKKETERSATVRRNTYAYKRASEESEDWIELDIHGSHDGSKWPSTRKDVLRKVACANRAKTIKLAKTKLFSDHCDGGYVRSLNYMEPISSAFADEDMMMTTTTMMGGVAASSSSPPNNTAGDAGQIAELASKLVALLQEGDGTMIPYRVIRCNFHNDRVSDEMLIMALSSCAVLVRGNFALKSSLTKFLKNEVMKEMRDLMLLLLNMHGSLSRDRLIRTFDVKASTNGAYKVINADTVTFVLETIAKLSNGSWLSKVEDDVFFAARFPELASYHAVYWTKKKEMLNELVELYEK
jgi:DNA-directed RNA polymerase-3 subunit RPC5